MKTKSEKIILILFLSLICPLYAIAAVNDIGEAARLIAQGLSAKLKSNLNEVTIGKLTLVDTQISSEFAGNFKVYLESEMKRIDDFQSVKTMKTMRTRGFSFDEEDDEDSQESQNKKSETLNAILNGNYRLVGDSVFVSAYLLDEKGKKLSEFEVEIEKSAIPWPVVPGNYYQVKKTESQINQLSVSKEDFMIELQINKGDGGVYRNGEELLVYFRTTTDCYLKVLYIDVDQNRILMYPTARDNENEILRSGREYNLHANNKFTIQPPFGSESIRAFCTTEKLASDKEINLGGGFKGYDTNTSTAEVVGSLRGLGVSSQTGDLKKSETVVYITTMP
jgi:hypothetical protein